MFRYSARRTNGIADKKIERKQIKDIANTSSSKTLNYKKSSIIVPTI